MKRYKYFLREDDTIIVYEKDSLGNKKYIACNGVKVWGYNQHKVPISLSYFKTFIPPYGKGTVWEQAFIKNLVLDTYKKYSQSVEKYKNHLEDTLNIKFEVS